MDYILNRTQINYILSNNSLLREQQEDIRQEKTCAEFNKGSKERNLCDVLNRREYLDITKPIIDNILKEKKKKWNEIVSKEERDNVFNTLKTLEKSEPSKKWSYKYGKRFKRGTIKKFIEERLPELYFIYDENNNWTYLSKLDTNYSDTAVLITDIFLKYKEEKILEVLKALSEGRNGVLKDEIQDIQKKYKDDILRMVEINDYTANSKKNTRQGEKFEVYAKNFLEKQGYKLIHSGGNGDPIDFLMGIDLIMEKDNKIFTFQVKSVYTINYESSTIMNPKTGAYKIYANSNLAIAKPANLDYVVFCAADHSILVLQRQFNYIIVGKNKYEYIDKKVFSGEKKLLRDYTKIDEKRAVKFYADNDAVLFYKKGDDKIKPPTSPE